MLLVTDTMYDSFATREEAEKARVKAQNLIGNAVVGGACITDAGRLFRQVKDDGKTVDVEILSGDTHTGPTKHKYGIKRWEVQAETLMEDLKAIVEKFGVEDATQLVNKSGLDLRCRQAIRATLKDGEEGKKSSRAKALEWIMDKAMSGDVSYAKDWKACGTIQEKNEYLDELTTTDEYKSGNA